MEFICGFLKSMQVFYRIVDISETIGTNIVHRGPCDLRQNEESCNFDTFYRSNKSTNQFQQFHKFIT